MLVKFCLAMLKCVKVGDRRYLMADLEEPCFGNTRHSLHVLALTVPQFILVVIGLPLLGAIIIIRNNHNINRYNFRIRYGLLYLGYRKNREWWEVVIASRKVFIVAIATFGSMWQVVDLQAFLALMVAFLSLVVHLIGKPFDVTQPKFLLLHQQL